MEASIKEPNIRHFTRLLQCAAKFGDELHMHADRDEWELAVTNSSKSAFCLFRLRQSFFSRWRPPASRNAQQRRGIKCQLLVKSLLAVLGKANSVTNVERVDFRIHDPDALYEKRQRTPPEREEEEYERSDEEHDSPLQAKLVMKLVCKHGVTKKHSLHLATSEFPRAAVDPASTPSGFTIAARTLKQWLDHFSISLTTSAINTGPTGTTIRQENQLSWMFDKREVRVKSWEGGNKELCTEIKVDVEEFEDYEVVGPRVDLTLPMREFRAALQLAEQLSIQLVIAFSEPTQPLTLSSDEHDQSEPFSVFCAIATTTCDTFSGVRTASETPHTARGASVAAANGHADGVEDRSRSGTSGSKRPPSDDPTQKDPSERFRSRPRHGSLPFGQSSSRSVSGSQLRTSRLNGAAEEGLFLGGGSQEMMGTPVQRSQQQVKADEVVQKELAMSQADLASVLEQMDEEDQAEEEEERAASQRQVSQLWPPSNAQPNEEPVSVNPASLVNLEVDESIFPNPLRQGSRTRSKSPSKKPQSQPEEAEHEQDEPEGDYDDDVEFDSTQAGDRRPFSALFED